MAELKYVQELMGTGLGTQGTLLIPRTIHDTIIDEVDKNLIPRSEAALYVGPGQIAGTSYDVDFQTPDTMDVRVVAEGAEIPIDNVSYTVTNYLPLKYGVAVKITRELLEDAKWDLLAHNLKFAGKRLAENENSLVVTALDAAANTVTGGAALTIANITRAMQYLEDSDYTPTTLFVGMEALNDLRNIDTFVEADKLGSREMLERGYVGRLYGLDTVKVSTNAGMTTTTCYVSDRTQAYGIFEKRPVTVERFEIPSHDLSAAAVTQRITVGALRTAAIAKITTT